MFSKVKILKMILRLFACSKQLKSMKAYLSYLYLTYYFETIFNPTIEIISVLTKNILQKSDGSLKKNTPINMLPVAPIPVHTA